MTSNRVRWKALVPALLVAAIVVMVAVGPYVAPHDPQKSMAPAFLPPGGDFLLGTDDMGRDVLSRLLSYGWPMLVVPLIAVGVTAVTGICAGLLLVARKGRGRQSVQVLDAFLAVPPILTMLVLGYVLQTGLWTLVLIAIVINSPFTARFVRSLADSYFDSGFVEVSLLEGEGRVAIAFREILPNLWAPLLGELGNRFVLAMYILVTAGFLGIASVADRGDWGSMVTGSLGGVALNPASVVAPALGIGLLAICVNLLADQGATRR